MAEKNTESSRTQGSSARSQEQTKQEGEPRQRGTSGALQRRSSFPSIAGTIGLSPFSLVRRMMEDMDRMWEEFGRPASGGLAGLWSPPIETFERDGRFVVRADLPGLSPDDVRVDVQDDALVLEGERKSEFEAEEKGAWRSERTFGRFSRVIPLPDGAQADQAQAKFENGVLEVSVPVREDSSRRRRIEIQGASKSSSSVH
jgi:HSP20 family protein